MSPSLYSDQDPIEPFEIDIDVALALNRLRPGDHLADFVSIDLEIKQVAHGGFGLVFIGHDHRAGKPRVLKTLKPEILAAAADHRQLAALFVREALVWVGLWPHANLLTAQSVTKIHDVPFLVLEYAARGNLRELMERPDRRGPLPLSAALHLAEMIATGLVALHTPDPLHLREKPLVHRDLKPENILVDERHFAAITDFGLTKVALDLAADLSVEACSSATLPVAEDAQPTPQIQNTRSQRYQTRRGAALGTLAYMAPEQWEDAATAGPPADMYAFGLILSELFAGRGALLDLNLGYSPDYWRAAHAYAQPRSLQKVVQEVWEVPVKVEALYLRLLAKSAEERPTAAEALAVLQETVSDRGENTYTPPEIAPHTSKIERDFWQNWAMTHEVLGRHEEALTRIERALEFAPRDHESILIRASILTSLGRYEEAQSDYDASLPLIPMTDLQRRVGAYNDRGSLLSNERRYAEADAAYAEAIALMPNTVHGWANRGRNQLLWALAELTSGQLESAREHLTRARMLAQRTQKLNPENPRWTALAAQAQQLLGWLDHPERVLEDWPDQPQ